MSALPAVPQQMFDTAAFRAECRAENAIRCSKTAIAAAWDYQKQRFHDGAQAVDLIRERAAFTDALLGVLWDCRDWGDAQVSLVAVGGYGRGELHPHSDVDLLVLLGDNTDAIQDTLSGFLTLLWDIGLNIGHSVRTVDECVTQARADLTVLTNLMETRVLRGPEHLMARVRELTGPEHMWPSSEFFVAKLQEQEARHDKFADTEYNLEPNVKSSPGGLRDLQVIGWIAERHFGVAALEDIDEEEFLSPEERKILIDGRNFMWQVRFALHLITGREEDRLLFDHQRELAALWGLSDGKKLAVEKFMQVYYRWALALGNLNEVLIQNFDQAILRQSGEDRIEGINERFQLRNGYIEATHPGVFSEDPTALLEIFRICVNREDIVGITAPTIRLIRDHRHLVDESFRADPRNQAMFLDILRGPNKMARQLRRMSRYGILSDYLPEFGQIVGQMQHDLFHIYTVDAHTLEVVKKCRRFLLPKTEEKFPVSARVARRLRKPELLYIAALYHDIGKGRGGDHSELGAVDAQAFCDRHGLDDKDSELVVWLVRNHLLMSNVSQRKDISDPEVIQQFARHAGDEEHLDYLFVLTVADINATNPTLWNAWRGSLLRQLYTETRRAMRRGLDNPVDKRAVVNDTRATAAELLEDRGFTPEELQELWRERGEDYFLREKAADIVWHTEAIASHRDPDAALVLVRNSVESSVANTTQIFIYARSRAQLFTRICACMEQLDLSVHDARIYSANDGMTLDTFFVLASDGQPITEDTARQKNIKTFLTEALHADAPYPEVSARRTPRQLKSLTIPTETSMEVDPIKDMSVLEVSAPDRPGLLALIGQIFADFNIELQAAKIQTLGERVEDVFFITDENQQPITDPEICARIQQTIRDALDDKAAA